jgi:hypothetical protein
MAVDCPSVRKPNIIKKRTTEPAKRTEGVEIVNLLNRISNFSNDELQAVKNRAFS